MIDAEKQLLGEYGYKPSDVGASVPGQRFSRDVAAAKEMAGEKLHQAGQEIHKQMTEPSMQEKMMDRMHRAAWRRQEQQHHQHQQEQHQQHQKEQDSPYPPNTLVDITRRALSGGKSQQKERQDNPLLAEMTSQPASRSEQMEMGTRRAREELDDFGE